MFWAGVDRRPADGVQLIFVFFAEAVSKLPVAPLYALLFFVMAALIMFNTELFLVETVVSSICDEFPERLRKNHRHVMTFVVFIFFVLGVPFCSGVSGASKWRLAHFFRRGSTGSSCSKSSWPPGL